jgi:hypothetical protein
MGAGRLIYRYPEMQYKIIDGNPTAIKSELRGCGTDLSGQLRLLG